MSDSIDPSTTGAYKKTIRHLASAQSARDSLEPGKMGNKAGQTIDTNGQDPQELKTFHAMLIESCSLVIK